MNAIDSSNRISQQIRIEYRWAQGCREKCFGINRVEGIGVINDLSERLKRNYERKTISAVDVFDKG